MASIDFQPVVRAVAPTLATALLGPLGGIAASIAANAIFGNDTAAKAAATPKSIIEAVATSSDPMVIEKLKQAELDLKKYEAQNRFQFAQLDETNTENARQMRIAGFATNNRTADQLSWLIMISFLVVATGILVGCGFFISGYVDLSTTNPQTLVAVSGLIGTILGYFSSNAQQIVGFYFGSSTGSKAKSDQLDTTAQTAISAIVRQGQTAVRTAPGGTATAASGDAARELADRADIPQPGATAGPEPQVSGRPATILNLRPQAGPENWPALLSHLVKPHLQFTGSVAWHMVADGISIDGAAAAATPGEPATVRRAWDWFHDQILQASREFDVPIELIVALLCNESVGGSRTRDEAANAERKEDRFVSYEQTPERVSIGAMQTLISTARDNLPDGRTIGATDLRDPLTSIRAGAAYLSRQKAQTLFDPPLVGAAYNAGSIRTDPSPGNRWKLYCYPEGTGQYIDRLILYFNDAMRTCRSDGWASGSPDIPSFIRAFQRVV